MSACIIPRSGCAVSVYRVIRTFLERHNTGYDCLSALATKTMARLVNPVIREFNTTTRVSDPRGLTTSHPGGYYPCPLLCCSGIYYRWSFHQPYAVFPQKHTRLPIGQLSYHIYRNPPNSMIQSSSYLRAAPSFLQCGCRLRGCAWKVLNKTLAER